MSEKTFTKKGFTLIELIVVIAILAVVAAIAVPVAFGSLQRAKDRAAVGSINSIQSVLRTARTVAFIDDEFQGKLVDWKSGFIEYKNKTFSRVSTDPEGNEYETYVVNWLNDAGMHIEEGAYIYIVLNDNLDKALPYDFVYYAPKGTTKYGPNPSFVKPYYMYDSKKNTITKYDDSGATVIN